MNLINFLKEYGFSQTIKDRKYVLSKRINGYAELSIIVEFLFNPKNNHIKITETKLALEREIGTFCDIIFIGKIKSESQFSEIIESISVFNKINS